MLKRGKGIAYPEMPGGGQTPEETEAAHAKPKEGVYHARPVRAFLGICHAVWDNLGPDNRRREHAAPRPPSHGRHGSPVAQSHHRIQRGLSTLLHQQRDRGVVLHRDDSRRFYAAGRRPALLSSIDVQEYRKTVIGLRFGTLLFVGALLLPAQPLRDAERKVTEFSLANGMHFILLERHQVPVVSFHTLVNVGSAQDPAGQTG